MSFSSKAVFITGTDTDVGKTTISAALCYALSDYAMGYYKPVLSGALPIGDKLVPGDLEYVKGAIPKSASFTAVTGYLFEEALSPHLAAKRSGIKIEPQLLLKTLHQLLTPNPEFAKASKQPNHWIIEGAGGAACPLTIDDSGQVYTIAQLIEDMQIPVVIVCRGALGTLHHTVTTVTYLRQYQIPLLGLIVNGTDESVSCMDNLEMLVAMTGLPIVATLPYLDTLKDVTQLQAAVDENWNSEILYRRLFHDATHTFD